MSPSSNKGAKVLGMRKDELPQRHEWRRKKNPAISKDDHAPMLHEGGQAAIGHLRAQALSYRRVCDLRPAVRAPTGGRRSADRVSSTTTHGAMHGGIKSTNDVVRRMP